MLTIGIIGAGRIGRVHAKAASSISAVKAACIADPVAKDLAEFAASMGIAAHSRDYRDILNDKSIEAVFICSPSDTHYSLSMEALQAGKHIFCEKPVDLEISRVLEIREAVKKSGKVFMVGFNRRFDQEFLALREAVDSGFVGTVELVQVTSRDPGPPPVEYIQSSGGLYCDMMIHDFDMVRFLSKKEAVSVFAVGEALVDPAIGKAGDVDTAIATIELAGGAKAVITNSRRASYGYDQRAEVHGSKGCAMNGNQHVNASRLLNEKGIVSQNPLYFFLQRYMEAYGAEISAFVDAIQNKKPAPVGVEDALQSLLMAKAALLSQKEGRKVALSELLK